MRNKKRGVNYPLSFIFLLTGVFLAITPYASANDTFVYDNGSAVYPLETDDVRMVSEKITVNMSKGSSSVKCSFVFENVTDRTINAKLGFPATPDDYIYEAGEKETPPLSEFRSYIDGRETDVDIRLDKTRRAWMYWYTWDVSFPPKSRISLQNEYVATMSLSYHFEWFEYILTTGANWKGPIGKAEVEVIFPDSGYLRDNVAYICPEGYTINGSRIKWEFRDFIPKSNVLVLLKQFEFNNITNGEYIGFFKDNKYKGDIKAYSKNELAPPASILKEIDFNKRTLAVSDPCFQRTYFDDMKKRFVRLMRNEIYARHGRPFKSRDLQEIFGSASWYKPNPNYSDHMLNDIEKKNVEFILDYEKKMGWR